MWLVCILTSVGTSILTCLVMEACAQHRATDRIIGDYDPGMEGGPGTHRAA
jgi:hypothetical protein